MLKPRNLSLIAFVIGVSLLVFGIAGSSPEKAVAQAPSSQSGGALAGRVLIGTIRAAAGKPLEGVVVSARDVEKTFTTSVFTDEQGNYFFPVFDKGQYRVWAQAVGFEAGRAQVNLDPGKEIRQDFTLKTLDDFTNQLSGAEWVAALPGGTFEDRRMKEIFQNNCTACHGANFVLQNRFDRAGWLAIIKAMETATSTGGWAREPWPNIQHFREELADYLAKVRGPGPSPMKFQPLPRPTGDAARAVITEYDVPPALTPDELTIMDGSDWSEGTPSAFQQRGLHDVAADFFGNGWISSSTGASRNRSYAKIDAKTGKVTNYKAPGKNGGGRGSHEITTGPDGMIWMNLGGGLGRVDPQTEKLDIFDVPEGMASVGGHVEVDGKGKVWAVTLKGAVRFDPDTRQFTEFISPNVNSAKFMLYGLAADAEGNGWWADLTEDKLEASDIKTGKVREVQYAPRMEKREFTTEEDRRWYNRTTNLHPLSNNTSAVWARTPRRLAGDRAGSHVWSANFFGQDIASVDIRTLKVDYYDIPIPYGNAYDVHVGNNHVVWASLRNADRVGKFDPATKKWTVYNVATLGVEARNIAVNQKTGDVWLPSFRTSKAIRLQFRTEQQLAAVQDKN